MALINRDLIYFYKSISTKLNWGFGVLGTKPFEKAFERLPDELVEAYGLDVEQFLEYTINKK